MHLVQQLYSSNFTNYSWEKIPSKEILKQTLFMKSYETIVNLAAFYRCFKPQGSFFCEICC